MLKIPTVKECITKPLFTLQPDTDIYAAVDTLVAHKASGAPVVNEAGELVGILTEKDCLRVLSSAAYGSLVTGKVRDFMSEVKLTIPAHMDMFAAVQAFLISNFARLPVENDKLVGTVSRKDMLRAIQDFHKHLVTAYGHADAGIPGIEAPQSIEKIQKMVASQSKEQLAAVFSARHVALPPEQ